MKDVFVCGTRDVIKAINGSIMINTTSRAKTAFERSFSPFFVGPIKLPFDVVAKNMENAWQYCKVYPDHTDQKGEPSVRYFTWARAGWSKKTADRYPMGKGAKPKYSLFGREKMGYIEARLKIYFPLYRDAVKANPEYVKLKMLHQERNIILFDFDGYNHDDLGLNLAQVLLNDRRPMGHAFVLKAMLIFGDNVTPEEIINHFGEKVPW